MTSNLGNVINYCKIVNGSKGFNDTKTQFINEITQDYNSAREDTIYRFNVLIGSNDAKDVYINNSDTPIKGVVDVKKKQSADTEMEEVIQTYPNQIKQGDYIKFKVNDTDTLRTYLIKSKIEKKHGYDEGVFKECNHLFKWMYKGNLYKAYGIGTNQTKYTLGTDVVQAGLVESDSRYAIEFSNDLNCKTIEVGQRFIFNDSAWKVTQIEYVSSQDTIRSVLLGQDSINQEIDDVEQEIAGAKANKHTYTYNIPTSIDLEKNKSINLVYSIKDETGKEFDYSLVTVKSTSNLIQVDNNKGVISITGLDIGTGSITLSVPSGEVSKEFIIPFEVKSVVADKIDYKVTTTNGYTYRPREGSTLTGYKYINGISDNTLIIDYSLDASGTNLMSKGNITIVKKSNTELQIRNVNISTPMSFTITITDKSKGTVILTQVIALKGA